ncbi:membrane protein insertase YidC [Methylocystis sp. L43]|jgi:YidC/Oxa1 family membrane protein insertase|uniref:membrane protein insertase YidC n=1 Tax=unclassified Methylocystis TaxID=2625913 RepID=UPI0018C22046|nr:MULTISPECIES: membrane protein insertase YidC [unclassified Methylocystis]MBG0796162.1 membrane protein insertase YidC [Methylocystis sp. L43]MBG0804084.1 membrane protein insertase YidC [Methylocystis sp. H15]
MSENIKNMILAAALSLVFIGLWDYFYAFPEIDKQRRAQTQQEQLAKVPQLGAPERVTAGQPPVKAAPKTRAEALALSPRIAIDTRSISGSIALKGGRIDDVSLKNYRETVDPSSPIITLLSPEDGPSPYYAELGYLTAETENAPVLPTTETLWTTDADGLTTAKPVTLTWDNGHGLVFKRVISVDDEYLFTVKDSVENKAGAPVTLFNYARVSRVGHPPSAGYAALHEGFVGVVGETGEEVTYDKIEKEDNAVKTYKGVGGWVGLTDKYWAAVVAPDQNLPMEARFASMGGAVKTYQADTVSDQKTIEPGKLAEATTYVFAGAKVVDVLDAYKTNPGLKRFDLLIDWGWFYFITRPMFRLIDFLYKLLGNFGLAILAVTVIVKLAFLPLANKSYQSIAKMKAIQPRIKELKEKYGDDKHKFNMEQMELFKREKVNPASGCLPVIVQIPVFFSLYKVLVVTIEMRHAPFFGWIRDLSAPDPTNVFNLFGVLPFDPTHVAIFGPYLALGVWPLLMGVSMWLQMKMNPEPADEIQKTMFAWMPVIFTFTMGGFASGLLIYWTWNNLLSIVQQGVIMKRAGVRFEFWDNLRKTFQRA